ncbi:MAG: DinB family protein [Chloroflexi bacterium]|nr:DinB family protein [Chloroflexota bacterium]
MLDFTPAITGQMTFAQFAAQFSVNDLRRFTNEMIDAQLALIADCADADVTFVPNDPLAHDQFAETEDELTIAWTLGHVIVHATATSEEAAAIACELARGVPFRGGRSRVEVPWRAVTTIAQCRQRLAESRRMRLALLDAWPNQPDLQNAYQVRPGAEPRNAVARFIYGLKHDTDHLKQIVEIVKQAKNKDEG